MDFLVRTDKHIDFSRRYINKILSHLDGFYKIQKIFYIILATLKSKTLASHTNKEINNYQYQ